MKKPIIAAIRFYQTRISPGLPPRCRYITIGASGAIYGLLLAFAMYFPKDRVYIFIWMFVLMAASLVLNGVQIPALQRIGALIDEYSVFLFLLIFFLGQNGKGLVPMQNRWFIAIMTAIELFMGIFIIDGVAHFAHLGGMLVGLLLILWWRRNPFGRNPFQHFRN